MLIFYGCAVYLIRDFMRLFFAGYAMHEKLYFRKIH